MKIEQAIKHFHYKLSNHWKPSEADIKAFDTIKDYVIDTNKRQLKDNDLFAKLFIERFILLCRTKCYTSAQAINVIDECLQKSVYDWCMILKDEIPMLRFNSIGAHKYPLKDEDIYNFTKTKERNRKIVAEFETELTEAFLEDYNEDKTITFIENTINKLINKHGFTRP